MGWMPIETAPKDGGEFVGHDEATGTSHVTFWTGYGWYDPGQHYYSEAPAFKPTIWFAYPKPARPLAPSSPQIDRNAKRTDPAKTP